MDCKVCESVSNYLERVGLEFDIAVNVLTGGQLCQTVSMRSALAWRDGKLWGYAMCWFLNWAVQRNHCALQFTDSKSTVMTYLRAGVAFAVGGLILAALVHAAVDIL